MIKRIFSAVFLVCTLLGTAEGAFAYTSNVYSLYEYTDLYSDFMQTRMNCYDYALQIYCDGMGGDRLYPGDLSWEGDGFYYGSNSIKNKYRMAAAESLPDNYNEAVLTGILNDFEYVSQFYEEGDWSIKLVDEEDPIEEGYRRILAVVRFDTVDPIIVDSGGTEVKFEGIRDYHFFIRHSDGMWSHKLGSGPITNLSLNTYDVLDWDTKKVKAVISDESGEVLTDENINVLCTKNGYTDFKQYFDISKSANPEYNRDTGRGYGHNKATIYDNWDGAGHNLKTRSSKITNQVDASYPVRINYPGDVDYFSFDKPYWGLYEFSLNTNFANMRLEVLDDVGSLCYAAEGFMYPRISCLLEDNEENYTLAIKCTDWSLTATPFYTITTKYLFLE